MTRVAGLLALTLAGGIALGGCSQTSYVPVVDLKQSKNGGANYEQDLNECQALAGQRDPASQTVQGAGVGALVGAGLGAALGALSGRPGGGAATGAVLGGAGGGLSQGAGGFDNQRAIIVNCLRGRGYAVVGR
jgi:hypothetical protein